MRAVVILNWNDSNRVCSLANRCVDQKLFEIITVVDNGSSEEQLKYLENNLSSECVLLKNENDLGFSQGTNVGLKYLASKKEVEYIFIVSSDIVFSKNDVDACVECLINDDSLGVISTFQQEIDGKISCTCWGKPSYRRVLAWMFYSYRRKHSVNIIDYKDSDFYYTIASRASFLGFKKDCLIKCDYFDPNVFMYFEEYHLFARIHNAGYKSGVLPRIVVKHNHKLHTKGKKVNVSLFKHSIDSAYHYFVFYEKIGFFKRVVFRICCALGVAEERVLNLFRK